MKELTTGQLAKQSHVNVETLRYYEREGLLPEPSRSESGRRSFSPDMVARIRFIKRAQELGFTLKEIKELLSLRADPSVTCADVMEQIQEKIQEIDQKVNHLLAIKKALEHLSTCADLNPASECPILENLSFERSEACCKES
ncbi:MAG: MerR family transcriptional regulator [Cyanobacteria bacterium]|nr:MerR family transcriptional regulator [Cyanobacteriota bacterium]